MFFQNSANILLLWYRDTILNAKYGALRKHNSFTTPFIFGRPVIFMKHGKGYKCEYRIGSSAKLGSFTKFIFQIPNLFKQLYFLIFYRSTGTQFRMSNKGPHETTKFHNLISFSEVHLFSSNVFNYHNVNIK